MTRFSSLSVAPSETRQILRDRFTSKLMSTRQSMAHSADSKVVADDLVLRLLAGLKVFSHADWSIAECVYKQAQTCVTDLTDLSSVLKAGWLRCVWGRVGVEYSVLSAIRQAEPGQLDALQILISALHRQRYEFEDSVRNDGELTELIKSFESADGQAPIITTRTPEWIVARLWEVLLKKESTSDAALRRWVDLWGVLQYPSFVPGAVWGAAEARLFLEAALRVLSEEPELLGWSENYDRFLKQSNLESAQVRTQGESDLPLFPRTPVEKALWLQSPLVERFAFESLELFGDLVGLMRLVLSEAGNVDQSSAPHPIAAKIYSLASERAILFNALLFEIQANPRLLADIVIDPRTSGLACLLIAQWRPSGLGWERDLLTRTFLLDQAEAFDDAVSILGEHLRLKTADASDAAALLRWFHERAGPGFIDDVAPSDTLYVALRRELASCDSSTLLEIANSVDVESLQRGLEEPDFATMLELCDMGGIEDQLDAEAIVVSYANSIAAGEYSLSTNRIGPSSAAALDRISQRNESLRQQFLFPMNVRDRLSVMSEKIDNEYIVANTVGRSIRAHIRVLCRAAIGGSVEVKADLFKALVIIVRAGALEHKEKGRVAAFAPRQEGHSGVQSKDRPLAFDLAAVLGCLDKSQQDIFLAAVLETDEPLILAQLLQKCPSHLKGQVEARIASLAPTDAGAIHSLSEMQARISQLIAAGAADAAALYIEAEEQLKTMGKVPGRELQRFQNHLQLQCLCEDWSAILSAQIPASLSQLERQSAQESLEFFQAIAVLQGPNGDPLVAKATFARLFERRPSWALATNWFAASLRDVLRDDGFAQLKGPQILEGKKLLLQAQSMISNLQTESGEAAETFECNRALLLLALSEPGQALASLSAVAFVRLQDTAAAYRAVAYARLAQKSKATAELDVAEYACGRTPVLSAARSHIASGTPYLTVPDVSVHDNLNLPSAIARFLSMDPQRQAQVLKQENDAFELLLIEYVRGAADAVTSLVPMMKGVRIDSCEDDLNAFIHRILAARVQFLGWTVEDQSKGGFTAKGNPGERDLLVKWGHSTLSVIEALICDRSISQDSMKANLESHFQKLLGYSTTQIFFHLTYAYIEDKQSLLQFLEAASETACPPDFVYKGREQIAHLDSRPPGFVASYQADFGEIKVVFLVLNLGQQRQRAAAKAAEITKGRKAPKKEKSEAPQKNALEQLSVHQVRDRPN